MTTRRHFLVISSATTILAALLPAKLLLNRRTGVSLDTVNVERFAPLVNSKFTVNARTANAVALKLVSAQSIDSDPNGRSFSLLFTGPANHVLEQRIHELQHEELGVLNVFMVPHHSDRDVRYYGVLFNRAA